MSLLKIIYAHLAQKRAGIKLLQVRSQKDHKGSKHSLDNLDKIIS